MCVQVLVGHQPALRTSSKGNVEVLVLMPYRRKALYLCDLAYHPGETPLHVTHENCQFRVCKWPRKVCSNIANHEPEPEGYIARFEWAKLMGKTHKQSQCPDCGLWAIWRRFRPFAKKVA